MRVTVRYHALLREKTGLASEVFEFRSPAATVDALISEFTRRHATLAGLVPALKAAVNNEIAAGSSTIQDGDEIDLLPPFGGG